MYERKPEPGPSGMYPGAADAAEYSSSSSDEGGEGGGLSVPMHTWQTVASPMGSEEEEEDEEEEYTMKVRNIHLLACNNRDMHTNSCNKMPLPQQRRVSSHTKYRVTRCSNASVLIKAPCGC